MIIDVETLCLIALLKGDDHTADWEDTAEAIHIAGYACGLETPNYPVPALVRAHIGRYGIYIYSVNAEYTAWLGPLQSWRY